MKASLSSLSLDSQPPSRQAIRAELEAARIAFHDLLARMSSEDWRRQSSILAWTNGHLSTHILSYLTIVLPRGVRYAQKGRRTAGFPPLLVRLGIADRANKRAARWLARRHTPTTLRAAYDQAHADFLTLLDQVPEGDWEKSTYVLGKSMTILELFLVHAAHFDEHRPQVRHYPSDRVPA